jgi:hypothetical protein
MKELIERLEKAEGPNPELDEAIGQWLVGCGFVSWEWFEYGQDGPYLKFTSSIDAALTLVPEGAHWAVYRDENSPQFAGEVGYYRVDAANPALALSAAALVYIDEEAPPRTSPAESQGVSE